MTDLEKQDILLDFIRSCAGAQDARILDFSRLSGGAVQENYGLQISLVGGSLPGEQRFVVRTDAPGSLSASLDRAQEFRVLQQAHGAGVHAPQPYWLCTDTSLIGAKFYVMQWAAGSASPRALVKADGLTDEQRQTLLYELGQDLARLHQVAYHDGLLPFLEPPQQDPARRRIQNYRTILAQRNEWHPVIEAGLACLERYVPDTQAWVLCHGDFRTGNYLVQEGHLSAVLDWEFAGWSDPYEDLGWMCARSWRFGCPEREAGGVGSKADLFAGYESISGKQVDPDRVTYWELMASVKWAVLALEQSHRFMSGSQPSLELALTGRMLPEIQQDLLAHLHDLRAVHGLMPSEDSQVWTALLRPISGTDQGGYPDLGQPGGQRLLDAASRTLREILLPALPVAHHYEARMMMRALDIARREWHEGAAIAELQKSAIERFYECLGGEWAITTQVELAQDIRSDAFAQADWPVLLALLERLLDYQLMLSNPKRVRAAREE